MTTIFFLHVCHDCFWLLLFCCLSYTAQFEYNRMVKERRKKKFHISIILGLFVSYVNSNIHKMILSRWYFYHEWFSRMCLCNVEVLFWCSMLSSRVCVCLQVSALDDGAAKSWKSKNRFGEFSLLKIPMFCRFCFFFACKIINKSSCRLKYK